MAHLNAKQGKALLYLYSEEIKKRLSPIYYNPERIGSLRQLVDLNMFEEMCLYSIEETEFTESLWKLLMSSPVATAVYDTILNYLCTDVELHSLLCSFSDNDTRTKFRMVLSNLEGFWTHLDVSYTLNFFKRFHCYSTVISQLEPALEGIEAESTKKKLVLRTIPLIGENATYDLMRSIYDTSEDAAAFVNKLHPNFLPFYDLVNEERESSLGVFIVCPPNVPIESVLDPSTESKYKINLNYEDLPCFSGRSENVIDRVKRSIGRREIEETPVLLRDYQKELCESSLSGNNTIIVAPNGCGKTVVAAYIIKNHLEKAEFCGRENKVLFMTPTTAVLERKSATLEKFLGHRYQVYTAHATSNVPLHQIIMAKDVIVATPQLILNLVNCSESSDIDMVRAAFDITTFTMVVFDECHNAVKNSPYAVIMRILHRLDYSRRIRSGYALPQILGLTASFGVGGASAGKDAISHVVKVCATLNCMIISTVQKNTDEIRRYSSDVGDEILFCNEHISGNRPLFLREVCTLMKLFEENLYDICGKCAAREPSISDSGGHTRVRSEYTCYKYTMAPEDKTSLLYQNWVTSHLRRIVPGIDFAEEVSKARAIEILEILQDLYRAIELFQNFSSVESLKYLKEQMTLKEASLTESSRCLWTEFCGKLERLQSPDNVLITELVKQLRIHKNNLHAIVFVRTRRGASILSSILKSHPDLVADNLRIEWIAGFTKNCSKTTKRDQFEKMKRFREGEIHVLISTSVAGEGLDVVKCNLVVKYNYSSKEITHLHSRGRMENSRSILITQNLNIKEQKEKNLSKEHLVNFVLDAIQRKKIDLQSRIKNAIENLRIEMQVDEALIAERPAALIEDRAAVRALSEVPYELLCSKCDAFLCSSKYIKTYKKTHYCVCDPSFWSKTLNAGQGSYSQETKLYCSGAHCRNTLGRVLQISQKRMPMLFPTAFVLKSFTSSISIKQTVRNWRTVTENFFTPGQVQAYDILAMSKTMDQTIMVNSDVAPCLF